MRTKEQADAMLKVVTDRGQAEFDAAVEEAKRILAERDAKEAEALAAVEKIQAENSK